MKKYLIIGLAALVALGACSKQVSGGAQQEVSFRVANFTTKANVAFTGKDFAAYSWHHAVDGTVTAFMENEQVGQKGSEWKTLNNTYYWPKTGSLNFISYAPYMADKAKVTVTEESIRFNAYTVTDEDLMYADKALRRRTSPPAPITRSPAPTACRPSSTTPWRSSASRWRPASWTVRPRTAA